MSAAKTGPRTRAKAPAEEETAPTEVMDPKTEAKPEPDGIEKLSPQATEKIWIIGKPPELGGEENEWSKYTQRPLSYMAKWRFLALVADALAKSMAESEGGGMDQLAQIGAVRGRSVSLSDLGSVAGFMQMAARLTAYSPDFILDCYLLWLDVPLGERAWARLVMEDRWDPDNDKWGLSDETGIEIVKVFIDQNYDELRSFFVKNLGDLVKEVQDKETAYRDSGSGS